MIISSGAETKVNTYSFGTQTDQQTVALPDGGWVVIWASEWQDRSYSGIYQQAYNADGTTRGTENRVNTETDDQQDQPQISALADGGWVVTWISYGQDGDRKGVYQQAYNANGTKQGEETQVNTYVVGDQSEHEVTALENGGWVVTWTSQNPSDSNYDVYQQAYNADGVKQGGEIRINTYTEGVQSTPRITALSDGGWVVSWNSYEPNDVGIYQRVYNADGTARHTEETLASTTAGFKFNSEIAALPDGGWVVIWSGSGVFGLELRQQAYNADGTAREPETLVNTDTYGGFDPQITVLSDGGWVVTWSSSIDPMFGGDVHQQAYNADGTARAAETLVNTFTDSLQALPQITALADGGWVVTWTSYGQDGKSWDVFQQVYKADGSAYGVETGVNTETDGAQDAPKVTALPNGSWVVTWVNSQMDGSNGEIYQRTFWINEAPISQTIAAQTATEARAFKFTYAANTFVDPNALDKITITATLANGDPLPSWLTFNAATRTFSGTPDYTNIGAISIRVTATDREGETAVSNFTLTVEKEIPPAKSIKGTSDDDTLVGDVQKDTLYGYGGDDILDGKAGGDDMRGGIGNDTYIADDADDYVEEKSGEGTDLVKASVDFTLSAHVENLKLTGTASIDGTGNALANTITGNAASNKLSGGAGNDRLLGNDGDDALFGGSGNDVLAGGTGNDALYGGTGKDVIYAGAGNDKAYGGSGDDILYGAAGNDALGGAGGRDMLFGGAGTDKLNGGAGADKLHGGSGADMFIFASIKDSTVGAAGRDTIHDFSRKEGDKIDLKGIDASTTAGGNQAFSFIGTETFSKKAGELRYEKKGGDTYVFGDVNGDGKADFSIRLDSSIDFTKADFLL